MKDYTTSIAYMYILCYIYFQSVRAKLVIKHRNKVEQNEENSDTTNQSDGNTTYTNYMDCNFI